MKSLIGSKSRLLFGITLIFGLIAQHLMQMTLPKNCGIPVKIPMIIPDTLPSFQRQPL